MSIPMNVPMTSAIRSFLSTLSSVNSLMTPAIIVAKKAIITAIQMLINIRLKQPNRNDNNRHTSR